MGCGESKHAVATENTLIKSKSNSNSKNLENNPSIEKAKSGGNVNANDFQDSENIGNVKENEIPGAIKMEQPQPDKGKETENAEEKENFKKTKEKEGEKEKEIADVHGNVNANDFQDSENIGNMKENEIPGAIKMEQPQPDKGKETENAEEEKENFKKTEEKEGEKEKGIADVHGNVESEVEEKSEGEKKDNVGANEEVKADQEEQESVISHEVITNESIITEGVSGKSDNDSPRAKGNVSEGKVEEGKDGEDDSNKEKEEAPKVDDGKELVPAEETKSCGEEKTPAAQNENEDAAAPTTDVKAN